MPNPAPIDPVRPTALLVGVQVLLGSGLAVHAIATVAGVLPLLALINMAAAVATGHSSSLTFWIAFGVAAALTRAALLPVAFFLSHRADAALQSELRRRIVAHLGRLPLSYFDDTSSAAIKRSAADDVGVLHHLVGHALLDLAALIVAPIAVVAILAATSPALVPIALLPALVGLWLNRRTMSRIGATMPRYQAAVGELDAAATELVRGIAPVRLFGGERRVHRRFDAARTDYATFVHGWATGLSRTLATNQIAFSPLTSMACVAVLGCALLATGATDWIDVAGAVLLAPALGAPFSALGFAMQDVAAGRAALGRISDFLSQETVRGEATMPSPAADEKATIALRDVRVAYVEHAAASGIDLVLRPGTTTALVGRSGAGKSTVAQVVAGLRPPTAGSITLNGTEYADLDESDVVARVAWVPQDPRLLRASVADNIALAAPGATREQVIEAARAAHIHERITELPDGYDTVLGDGIELSGGQAQRVCLARALLAERPALVLDEATSALDEHTQRDVLTALAAAGASRAVLVIAHRLATVRDADEIVVLDGGRIVERGSHDELLAAEGHYYELWAEQQAVLA